MEAYQFRLRRPKDGGPWSIEVPEDGGPVTPWDILLGLSRWRVVAVVYSEEEGDEMSLDTLEPIPLAIVAGILEMVGRLQDEDPDHWDLDLPDDFNPEMN